MIHAGLPVIVQGRHYLLHVMRTFLGVNVIHIHIGGDRPVQSQGTRNKMLSAAGKSQGLGACRRTLWRKDAQAAQIDQHRRLEDLLQAEAASFLPPGRASTKRSATPCDSAQTCRLISVTGGLRSGGKTRQSAEAARWQHVEGAIGSCLEVLVIAC
jgi:hypothetical protein